MRLHISARPGLIPDRAGLAPTIPPFELRKVWHEFRAERPAGLTTDREGNVVMFDTIAPNQRFSVSRRVFLHVIDKGAGYYARMKGWRGDLIAFDRGHPDRRVFIPRPIFEDLRTRGLALKAQWDAEAAAALRVIRR